MSEEAVKIKDNNEKKVEVTGDMEELIKKIENMSVLDLSNLVKALEDKFGVSAATPVAVAVAPAGDGNEAVAEEKTTADVVLTSFGSNKIAVIKDVRAITGLGLKEAKELVDNLPKPVKEGLEKDEANKIKETLEKTGATVELK